MEEDKKEIYQAAHVILLIIKNEGAISDEIEYPPEFQSAYGELLELNVIENKDGEYVAGTNFEKAYRLGIEQFREKLNQPSRLQAIIRHRYTMPIVAGTVLAGMGYIFKTGRKN